MDDKLHILQHSLGLDQYGNGASYRNHFVTGPGSTDYPICQSLVAEGLMVEQKNNPLLPSDSCFYVTLKGRDYAALNSPKPPKLTRSQKRYRDYLAVSECYESFGHFLKTRS